MRLEAETRLAWLLVAVNDPFRPKVSKAIAVRAEAGTRAYYCKRVCHDAGASPGDLIRK
jgi:hypothetical protein